MMIVEARSYVSILAL